MIANECEPGEMGSHDWFLWKGISKNFQLCKGTRGIMDILKNKFNDTSFLIIINDYEQEKVCEFDLFSDYRKHSKP